jgi:hypothetical protein
MTRIGKFWTGAVAYVSLLVGAGLSVAGNLADTYRTRGADVDGLDKVMAAGWPILVLLAIEMFVSPRWSPARMFQVWRWIGCLAVGGMAMVVSWTHLHDLMASRGQLYVVTVLGPLAIDGMAIMATGLILSTRVRGHMATAMPSPVMTAGHYYAGGSQAVAMDMTADTDKFVRGMAAATDGHDRWADLVTPDMPAMDTRLMDWVDGHERAATDIGESLAAEAERYMWNSPADTDTLPRRVTGLSCPQEFTDMAAAWDPGQLARADMVKLSAAHFGVSTRTVRRWLAACLNEPISGQPQQ